MESFHCFDSLYNMFVSEYNHFLLAIRVEENIFACQILKVVSVLGGEMSLYLASGLQSSFFPLKVMHCRFFDQYQFRRSRTSYLKLEMVLVMVIQRGVE